MLSRSVKDGEFTRKKSGKNVFYGPSAELANDISGVGAWAFSKEFEKTWDGQWFIVTYQIPDERRELRERLRYRLTRMGFGRLTHSVWISPYDQTAPITEITNKLNLNDSVMTFRSKETNFAPEALTSRAWALSKIAQNYLELIELLNKIKDNLPNQPSDQQAFGAIWEACMHFVMTVNEDPRLPIALLPKDWPGNQAIHIFKDLDEYLYPKALNYFENTAVYF